MTTSTPTSTNKGLPALITPYSTSEFHAMIEAARAHHWGNADRLQTMAAELYRALVDHFGAGRMMGADVKIAARRVTRHLAKAANYNVSTAQAIAFSYHQYTHLFLNSRPNAPRRGFDPDK
jgi:hypothetical protein